MSGSQKHQPASASSKSTRTPDVDFYVETVAEAQRILGPAAIALDQFTLKDVLEERAMIDRAGLADARVQDADRLVLLAGVAAEYSQEIASLGPEWCLHLREIHDGEYPIEQIPDHLRDLAQREYYSN